ncbi:MAG: sensor histidine kinase [Gemmatimonas sp.]|uniref:sensor histidine kinase n=1 Tax=Gemmatimonas sp. TaxID=1962908 RepID=UPI0022C77CF4|nr:HAMP domain-containing sensor histidine kinase [Gemmatimonas sp.]MCA2982972.1 HAMP domain-containing histidine kinase [Gemmatimonas sp.]MCA2989181.1 HAMP domain-containing histidine kinase [Gemmatimonas sp.]MCA2994903.1 HAMP domain-containing histidine kinase [Gemmatimonas sp.]MCE2954771.1 HAMP domain-containing histidine kinase [Gemmatimonas sp.]MCZ8011288.1 HAMP domain-containing sensor histidine kinase [Gemmatimonas sp.]
MSPVATEGSRPRIRLRFTALYAATLLVVLVGAATVLRFALRATLQREFEESVRASAGLVTQFFRTEVNEYRTIEATLTHISGELVFEDRIIRYRAPDGRRFRGNRALATPVVPALRTPMQSVRFPLDADLAPGWQVEVDASMTNMLALQARIDRWFLFGIPLLVLTAAVAGWWLTGRTLSPVGSMADAAARIAPASGTRLPVTNPDDELGRLGTRFNALLDRLDGALAQQRQFIADAAHELRTPIARMRARVELALLKAPDVATGADRTEILRALDAELRAITHQVDELLQLARADAAGDEAVAHAERLFLDDLVADELPRWQPQAEQLGVALTVGALEEAAVRGDAVLLARLCGVLVDNALRYSGTPGNVRVSVQARTDVVVLTVEDNGRGVPVADRVRIFDRFFRGEEARHRRADGSGLGLAIASWIVRRHGGTIRVDDSELGGARFVVELGRATVG